MGSLDLYRSIDQLLANGLEFMPAPNDIYYSRVDQRLPKHGEPLDRLQRNGILIDGEGVVQGGYTKVLLQRFSRTVLGPIFFEFIQRATMRDGTTGKKHLDLGFDSGNAQGIFKMTAA